MREIVSNRSVCSALLWNQQTSGRLQQTLTGAEAAKGNVWLLLHIFNVAKAGG